MTDQREAGLAMLRARVGELIRGRTVLAVGDTAELPLPAGSAGDGPFDCVLVAFEWSRVARDAQDAYLAQLRARSGKDALLVMVDDVYIEGTSPTIARTDAQGNTYYRTTGPDGVQVEVPKSYPSDSALRKRLAGAAREIRVERFAQFWMLTCRFK